MADENTGQPAVAAPETKSTETTAEVKTEVKETKVSLPEPQVKDTQTSVTKEPPKKAASAIEAVDEDIKTVAPADFPEDWRVKMAGGDEKLLKRLERMKSPLDVANWAKNAEKQWKQGADPDPFPDKGTPEEQNAWRKSHNIPEKSEEYIKDLSLPSGVVIGEHDKPRVNEYLEMAHKANLPPEVVKQNIGWYFTMREQEMQQRLQKDEQDKKLTGETLRSEMGNDFKKYLGAAYQLLESAPEGILSAISESRKPDGTKLGNDPNVVRWLSQMALEINPTATVTPGSGTSALTNIETEIAEIEKLMATDRNAYFSNDAKQARYRELVTARDKVKSRKAA